MIRGLLLAAAAAIPVVSTVALRRATDRLLAGPRRAPGEAALAPAIDALGGEVVRLRARDGVRLSARWLLARPEEADEWRIDPHEAVLLLHGYSGSIAPDLVEYAPFLRSTAAVLGLDFRGHGDSDEGPTTFGLQEVEDVAGALAWLGERGIRRVALMGTSMGGITALASVVVLGDGRLAAADLDPAAPRHDVAPARPRIVGVVADSVAPEIATVVGGRLPGPFGRSVAQRLFDLAARRLGGDPRATEPGRIVGLIEGMPLLLVHGAADELVPLADAHRLAGLAPEGTRHLVVDGASHSGSHAADPTTYEGEVTAFLRRAFATVRETAGADPILPSDAAPGSDAG